MGQSTINVEEPKHTGETTTSSVQGHTINTSVTGAFLKYVLPLTILSSVFMVIGVSNGSKISASYINKVQAIFAITEAYRPSSILQNPPVPSARDETPMNNENSDFNNMKADLLGLCPVVSPDLRLSQFRVSISPSPSTAIMHFTVIAKQLPCEIEELDLFVSYKTSGTSEPEQSAKAVRTGCFVSAVGNTSWRFYAALLMNLNNGISVSYKIGKLSDCAKSLETSNLQSREFDWRKGQAYLILSDMGPIGVKKVADAAQNEEARIVLHIGDQSYASNTGECYASRYVATEQCSYNCSSENCAGGGRQSQGSLAKWEQYFSVISAIMDKKPWMTTMGNHDNDLTWFFKFRPPISGSFPGVKSRHVEPRFWDQLKKVRFMNATSSKLLQYQVNTLLQKPYFYSFNDGITHFISFGTEDNPMNAYEMNSDPFGRLAPKFKTRFEEHYGPTSEQYKWLEEDLASLNRTETPWIIVYTHRPMYHSSGHHASCTKNGDWYGCELRNLYSKLFEKYGVDIIISGHAHHYQRSKPLVQGKPALGKNAPIYVVCGTGGFKLDRPFATIRTNWIDYRQSSHFGYCKFKVHNSTHLEWSHIAIVAEKPQALDTVFLVKEKTQTEPSKA